MKEKIQNDILNNNKQSKNKDKIIDPLVYSVEPKSEREYPLTSYLNLDMYE